MKQKMTLRVNGAERELKVDPSSPLLYVLRNDFELNGPKYGCGLEQCGSCMVLIGGEAKPSCRMPVSAVADQSMLTIEGMAGSDGTLHPLQEAVIEEQAAQCGYCINGMLIKAYALLQAHQKPSRDKIVEGLKGSLCRCGTHSRFIRAVENASRKMNP